MITFLACLGYICLIGIALVAVAFVAMLLAIAVSEAGNS